MMNGSYDGMFNGWMMGWMFVWFLVGVAILVVAVFAIVRLSRPRPKGYDEAHELLRRRFAAGEIDADEYASCRDGLGRSH